MVFDKSGLISNIKAFTLFTAMVSFIVIGIGVLVIQHMSNSEHNYNQIISSLHRQQEMDSTKDLIRLDALKVFNVLYRKQVFDFFDTNTDEGSNSEFIYQPIGLAKKDWNTFVDSYINEMYFNPGSGANPFASYVANKLLSLLYQYGGILKGTYQFKMFDYSIEKSYFISNKKPRNLFKINTPTTLSDAELRLALSDASTYANNERDFYRLVDCPLENSDEGTCKNGSFYTNLYFNKVDEDTYLNLPRVLIERLTDKSAMDDSILPKNIISQYIPLRIFGAMALARTKLNNLTTFQSPVEISEDNKIGAVPVNFERDCSQFDGTTNTKLQEGANASNNQGIKQYFSLGTTPSTNHFDINLDRVESQKQYTEKYIKIYALTNNTPLAEFSTKRVVSAKFYVSVTDTDPFSSFGHGRGMKYGFYGVKRIDPIPDDNELPVNILICNCKVKEDHKLDCSTAPYEDKSKAGMYSTSTNVRDLINDSTLKNTVPNDFLLDTKKLTGNIETGLQIKTK